MDKRRANKMDSVVKKVLKDLVLIVEGVIHQLLFTPSSFKHFVLYSAAQSRNDVHNEGAV